MLQNGRVASEVLPLQKRGGGQTLFSHAEGRGNKTFLGSLNMLA